MSDKEPSFSEIAQIESRLPADPDAGAHEAILDFAVTSDTDLRLQSLAARERITENDHQITHIKTKLRKIEARETRILSAAAHITPGLFLSCLVADYKLMTGNEVPHRNLQLGAFVAATMVNAIGAVGSIYLHRRTQAEATAGSE